MTPITLRGQDGIGGSLFDLVLITLTELRRQDGVGGSLLNLLILANDTSAYTSVDLRLRNEN